LRGSSVCFGIAEGLGGLVVSSLAGGGETPQLQLDLTQAREQPVALVAERARQRDHGLDETPLALFDAADGRRKDLDRRVRGHRRNAKSKKGARGRRVIGRGLRPRHGGRVCAW
jgi:hypothetical protein